MKIADEFKDIMSELGDLRVKESELKKSRIESQYEDLQRRQKEIEKNKSLNVSGMQDSSVSKIQDQIGDYFKQAKNSQIFLNDSFKGKIPMFARNLIFIGAESGNGKSTLVANLAFSAISQKGCKKILIITNEEHTTDVYNRITCLIKQWNYSSDHSSFTDEQVAEFIRMVGVLSKRITVVDDSFGDSSGVTTTLEGMQSVFDKLVTDKAEYDMILIDYYQNVDYSSKNPELNEYQVQERFARYLDIFKNRYNAPIVLLGQLKPYDDEKTPFKLRIEGRKTIYNASTTCVEVQRDTPNHRSKFIIRKSRFPAALGEEIMVGFDKGKLVKYDSDFASKVEAYKMSKQTQDILKMKMERNGEKG